MSLSPDPEQFLESHSPLETRPSDEDGPSNLERVQVSTLYIGNLPQENCEIYLRQVLHAQEISFTNLVIKRGGYAFVDCTDQNMADRAIDKLNGHGFLGAPLHVEPVAPTATPTPMTSAQLLPMGPTIPPKNNSRILINNVPSSPEDLEELKGLLQRMGNLVSMDRSCIDTSIVLCLFDDPEQGQQAVEKLNGFNLHGNILTVEPMTRRAMDELRFVESDTGGGEEEESLLPLPVVPLLQQPTPKAPPQPMALPEGPLALPGGMPQRRLPQFRVQRPRRRRGGMSAPVPALPEPPAQSNSTDFPLRLLVPGEMVGAIIGRQGTTIRRIIKETRARVDVHRKDSARSEQALTIYGKPENCSAACRRILLVMQEEAKSSTETQHRVEDLSIKVLAQSNLIGRLIGKGGGNIRRVMEETGAKISVSNERGNNAENVIVIQGDTTAMLAAEARVSSKLRQCFEADRSASQEEIGQVPNTAPYTVPPQASINPPHYSEVIYLHIPNRAVAGVLGPRGSYIRELMRQSGAFIRVPSELEMDGDVHPNCQQGYRCRISIIGSPEAQWKAQWLINEKLREEGWKDIVLTLEVRLPSTDVAKLIGPKGEHVAVLQQTTGTTIQLPWSDEDGMQSILINGVFDDLQMAQSKIRESLITAHHPSQPQAGRKEMRSLALPPPSHPQPTTTLNSAFADLNLSYNPFLRGFPPQGFNPPPCRSGTPPQVRDIMVEGGDYQRQEEKRTLALHPSTGPSEEMLPLHGKMGEGFRPGDEWGITIVELDRKGNRLQAQEKQAEAGRVLGSKKDSTRNRASAGGSHLPDSSPTLLSPFPY